MAKGRSIIGLLLLFFMVVPQAHALTEATFKSRCANLDEKVFPPCASSPNECGSIKLDESANGEVKPQEKYPFNCLFLNEPIGGKYGYDLYKVVPSQFGLKYQLWYGEPIIGEEQGPIQAVLVYEEGKDYQGPFNLLYNYLGLVYTYLSGIIIGFVIMVVVIGGIRIITARGDTNGYEQGKKMIINAVFGMILWFTASVILYTINPTFFTF